jgi:hypothetical protein
MTRPKGRKNSADERVSAGACVSLLSSRMFSVWCEQRESDALGKRAPRARAAAAKFTFSYRERLQDQSYVLLILYSGGAHSGNTLLRWLINTLSCASDLSSDLGPARRESKCRHTPHTANKHWCLSHQPRWLVMCSPWVEFLLRSPLLFRRGKVLNLHKYIHIMSANYIWSCWAERGPQGKRIWYIVLSNVNKHVMRVGRVDFRFPLRGFWLRRTKLLIPQCPMVVAKIALLTRSGLI